VRSKYCENWTLDWEQTTDELGRDPFGVCSLLIKLTYDVALELAFMVFGRYPIDLMNQIAGKKLNIYKSLSDDLGRPYIKVGVEEFQSEGRKFTVTFSSDTSIQLPANIKPLHVMTIEEHK